MKPFNSINEVTAWWKVEARGRSVSVLMDWTSIGQGIQRRTVYNTADGDRLHFPGLWIAGFPDGGQR